MKVAKIDKLGRIVIPMTIRKQLGIAEDDHLSIYREGKKIVISPMKSICRICGCDIDQSTKIELCDKCIMQIKEL